MICSLTGAQGSGCDARRPASSIPSSPREGWRNGSYAPMTPAWNVIADCLVCCPHLRSCSCFRPPPAQPRSSTATSPLPSCRSTAATSRSSPTRCKGVKRHVLYWGAVNWAEKFNRDYSGGWKSKVADYKRFSNNCKPYTGPRLPLMIAGCDAKDGSHWALQQWQRLWNNYGGSKAANELYISHWKGDAGRARDPDRLQLPRQAPAPVGQVHVPRQAGLRHEVDDQGRAARQARAATSTSTTSTKQTWRRVNSFLTHPPTAGFCYTFANHPASSPGWNGQGTGDAYRATAIGPGVTPVVQVHFAPPGPYNEDERRSRQRRAERAARPTTRAAASTSGAPRENSVRNAPSALRRRGYPLRYAAPPLPRPRARAPGRADRAGVGDRPGARRAHRLRLGAAARRGVRRERPAVGSVGEASVREAPARLLRAVVRARRQARSRSRSRSPTGGTSRS